MHDRARTFISGIKDKQMELADEALAALSDGDADSASMALEGIIEEAQLLEHAIEHPRFLITGYFKEISE